MSELAGGLGEGIVLVFQPATPAAAGLPVALGIQRLWQKTLKHAGRPAACILAMTRIETIEGTTPEGFPFAVGDRGVASIGGWPDMATNSSLVVERGGRWGLIATLVAEGTTAKLDTTLIEAKAGEGGHLIASWSFDGASNDLPAHVCAVLVDVARRVGTKIPWKLETEAFDHGDPDVQLRVLEMMGILSMAEDGCRLELAPALDRLAQLATAAPRASVVVALVPELLGHLARLGAHDLQLAGWVRGVKRTIGVLPPAWENLVSSISRQRGV
jgi:hypothetical protein